MSEPIRHSYRFGPFSIDPEKRLLMRDGEVVPLTPKAFDALLALVEHHGEVLEKDQLMEMLWPDSEVEEANLPLHISTVRKALGESPNERRYIVTVPGRGYRFAAEVEAFDYEGPYLVVEKYTKSTLVIQDQEHSSDGGRKALSAPGYFSDRRKLILSSLIGLVVLIAVAAWWLLLSKK